MEILRIWIADANIINQGTNLLISYYSLHSVTSFLIEITAVTKYVQINEFIYIFIYEEIKPQNKHRCYILRDMDNTYLKSMDKVTICVLLYLSFISFCVSFNLSALREII